MAAHFKDMRTHDEAPNQPFAAGSVTFSWLEPGQTPIICGTLSLKLVVEGEEQYEIGGRVHRLRRGEIMILGQAGAHISVTVPRGGPAIGLCINMPIATQPPEDAYQDLPFAPLHMPFVDHAFGRWLSRVTAQLATRTDLGPSLAPAVLATASAGVAGFLSTTSQRAAELSIVSPVRRAEMLHRVERARAYLHDNTGRAVKLHELAHVASLSPFHLARAFQAVHGRAPAAYHRAHRLNLAADMLSRAARSPGEVAQDVGFSDQASFTRAYTRHHGTTPGRALTLR